LAKKSSISGSVASRGFGGRKIAVLVPCYNEGVAVAKVVKDFCAALPKATIFVFDNNSTDNTAATARAAGAEVFTSVGLAIPIVTTFLETHLVPQTPTAILSTGMLVLAALSIAVGLILDTVTRGRRETKLTAYLVHRAPGGERRGA